MARLVGRAEADVVGPLGHLQRVVEQGLAHPGGEQAGGQFAHLPEPHHHGATRLAVGLFVEEHGMGAELRGIQAQLLAARQGAVELPVEGTLGADDGVAQVMPHQHRVARVGQIAMADADLEQRRGPRRFEGLDSHAAAKAHAIDGVFVWQIVGEGLSGQHEAFVGGALAPQAGGRVVGQEPRLAGHQQVKVARKSLALRTQGVVGGVVDKPHGHARQLAGCPGHGAVAPRGGLVDHALAVGGDQVVGVGNPVARHRGRLAPGNVHHVGRIGRGRQQALPGLARVAQGGAVHGGPAGRNLIAQTAPQLRIAEIALARRKGQQLHQAGKAPHDVDDAPGATGEIEQGQLELGGVFAHQPAHRLVGAGVGCA